MKYFLFLSFAFLLFGCKSTADPVGPKLDEEFNLKYEQTVQLQYQNLTIKFTSVVEDSRCPKDAICVWEGNAKITIQFNATEFTLNTAIEPKEIESLGYLIKLISVSPYPKLNDEIELEDYIITLIVTK